MMNAKQEILEKLDIKNKAGLSQLLDNSTTIVRSLNQMTLPTPVMEFKISRFLKGLKPILNEVGHKEVGSVATQILKTTFAEFGLELSEQECFVLFQLRDLGKFRIKDSKLFSDLEKEWNINPEFKVEKAEFKYVLYELKSVKLIDIRRGSITLTEQIIVE